MKNVKRIEGTLGQKDLSNVEKKVDIMNQKKRLPVVILIDTSASMGGYEELLRKSVEELYEDILSSTKVSAATELAIMTFNNEIEVHERLREIHFHTRKGHNLDIRCKGETLTGLALRTAIAQIEGRKEVYRSGDVKIRNYSPIIFLLSDGKPECYNEQVMEEEKAAMQFSKYYINEQVKSNNLVVIGLEIGGGCNHKLMQELTGLPNDRHLLKIENTSGELTNFFKMASDIIKGSSQTGTSDLNNISFAEMVKRYS